MKQHVFFYLAISAASSLSLSSSSLSCKAPMPAMESSDWRNAHHPHSRTKNYRSYCNKLTYRNLFPPTTFTEQSVKSTIYISTYFFTTNMTYLLRRSHLRNMPKRKLLQTRLAREAGVSLSLYITNIIIWQLFVTTLFPILELLLRFFGHVSYYYFYPNASGFGIIMEPLSAQLLSMSDRAKHQIRCDWHRFSVNVGAIGRDGYRHPPSVSRNALHIDMPRKGLKHWPWRRKHVSKSGNSKGR